MRPSTHEEGTGTRRNSLVISAEQLIDTSARIVQVDELSQKDILIALMGPTGSGKSSFIEIATGMTGLVGHGLATYTTTMSIIRLSFPDLTDSSNICFVDTPGFDDTSGSDVEMFRKITNWLNLTHKRKICLSGLLYFHRISDNRMAGSLVKNFRLFEQICGKQFNRIILVTTMWDQVDDQTGLKREDELANIYWKVSIDRGSSVARFQNTGVSAFEAIMPILRARSNTTPRPLLLQQELENGLELSQTTAGRILFDNSGSLMNDSDHQRVLQQIQEELTKPGIGDDLLRLLTQKREELASQLPPRQTKKSYWKAGLDSLLHWMTRLRKTKNAA